MFQLDKTIVSEELFEKDFVCNLSACKGFCCVDGDAGAPVSEEEAKIMEAIYPKVKPYLTAKGKKAIEEHLVNFKYDSNLALNGNRIIGLLYKDG